MPMILLAPCELRVYLVQTMPLLYDSGLIEQQAQSLLDSDDDGACWRMYRHYAVQVSINARSGGERLLVCTRCIITRSGVTFPIDVVVRLITN